MINLTLIILYCIILSLLLIAVVGADKKEKTYYEVLGVDKKASIDQIKKSYRKLAKACLRYSFSIIIFILI
jgi:preprotein translocase subunit Sec63